MDAQLQQLIELQTKQNQLLERYLWRFRFSLMALLLLTTGICCCLGFVIYTQQTDRAARGTVVTRGGVTFPPVYYAPTPVPTKSAQMQPVFPSQNAVPTPPS